jgi:hypothetical protein
MAAVLLDSFEQPLSNTKTPRKAAAISEPMSVAVFCLPAGFFVFGHCAADDWLSVFTGCFF